jgi:hypothetical protein
MIGETVVSESMYLIGDTLDPFGFIVQSYSDGEQEIYSRVLRIVGNTDKRIAVTIKGLTISGGDASGNKFSYPGKGGGIYNEGAQVTIEHVRIINNAGSGALTSISNGYGGGIYNGEGGHTIIKRSDISNNYGAKNTMVVGAKDNFKEGYGGGLYNAKGGSMEVLYSSIEHNIASQGRRFGCGGGLANYGDTVLIAHSSIGYNYANYSIIKSDTVKGLGGGIYNDGAEKPAVLRLLGSESSLKIIGNAAAYVYGKGNYDVAYGYGGGIANGINGRIYYGGETLITGNCALGNQNPADPASGKGYGGGMYQNQSEGGYGAYWFADPLSPASKDTLYVSGNLAADTLPKGAQLPGTYGHEVWVGNDLPPSMNIYIYCGDKDSVLIKQMIQFREGWHWGYQEASSEINNVLSFTLPFPYNRLEAQVVQGNNTRVDIVADKQGIYRYHMLSNGGEDLLRVNLTVKPFYELPLKVAEGSPGLTLLYSELSLSEGESDTVYITAGGEFSFGVEVDESYGRLPQVSYEGKVLSSKVSTEGSFYSYWLTASSDKEVICEWDPIPPVAVQFYFVGQATSNISLVSKSYGNGSEYGGSYIPKGSTLTFRLQVHAPYHDIKPTALYAGYNDTVKGKLVEGALGLYEFTETNIRENTTFIIKHEYQTIVIPEPPQGITLFGHSSGTHYHPLSDTAFSFILRLYEGSKLPFPDVRSSALDAAIGQQQGKYVLPKTSDHVLSFIAKHYTVRLPARLPSGIQLVEKELGNNYLPNPQVSPFQFQLKLSSFPNFLPKVVVNGYELPVGGRNGDIVTYSIPLGEAAKDINVTIERHIAVVRAMDEKIQLLSHRHPSDTFRTTNREFVIEFTKTQDYLTPKVTVQNGRVLSLTESNGIYYCTVQAGESFSANSYTGIYIKTEGSPAFSIDPPTGSELHSASALAVQGTYSLPEGTAFTFSLKMEEAYVDAVPVVKYGGKELLGEKEEQVWKYGFVVAHGADLTISLDYVEIGFDIRTSVTLSGLKKEMNVLKGDSTYKFAIEAYYPYHTMIPIVNSEQVEMGETVYEVPDFKTVYNYLLRASKDEIIKVHTDYRTLSFRTSSDLKVKDEKGNYLDASASLTVSDSSRNVFHVIVPDKYGSALPGVTFNGALIQPVGGPFPSEDGYKYYTYVVLVKKDGVVNVGMNCAKVIFNGLGNSISLVSPAVSDTHYVTPGTVFKFRLKVASPYLSVVPTVEASHTGEYLSVETTGIDGLYDFSVAVGSGFVPVDLKVKLSTSKVILSVLNPEAIELSGGQNIYYFPQATEDSPNLLTFTLKVKDGFEYISPLVMAGTTRVYPVTKNNGVYTYILGNIKDNLLVDIQMVYARLKFSLSNGVTLVNTGQTIRPDGYYYLHADSTFTFSLRAPAGSPNAAPAVVAGDETLLPRSLSNGVYAYAFKVKSGETEIKISPYREITFSNDIPADIILRSHGRGIYYAPEGSVFEFSLGVKSSYKHVVPNIRVEGNGGAQAQLIQRDDENNIYRFAIEVKDDAILHFSLQTLTLRFATLPAGVTFVNDPGPFAQVTANGSFTFAVQVDEAHREIQPYVSAGGNPVTLVSTNEADRIYTYTVTANKSATVFVSLTAVTVFLTAELPEGLELAGNHVAGTYPLSSGQPFSFSVRKSSTVDASVRPTAHIRTEEGTWEILPVVNGEYYNFSLQEVTTNTEIVVDVNYRTLTLPLPSDKLILLSPLSGSYVVATGSTFKFSLKSVNKSYTYVPPTVITKNEVSYTFDEVNGVYHYTLKALYDETIGIELNYVTVTVDLATEGIALVSPSGLLYGKQVISAPLGGDCTLNLQVGQLSGNTGAPTIVVDQAKLVPSASITEISTGVYQTTLSQLTEDKYVKVVIPKLYTVSPVNISFLIADGVKVSLAGYEYRTTTEHTIYKGNLCQFFFQADEGYQDAEVALLVNGSFYDFTTLGGGNYAVNLGAVTFDTYIQILMAASKTTPLLPPPAKVKVTTQGNQVTVESEDEIPVAVYTLTGQMRLGRKIQGSHTFSLPGGIYILRAGDSSFKIHLLSY